ncbi:hypothetical protein DBV05_g8606 [Lasiodiplodia theobromae]|uniref:Uncharacterized protein n=1 Tax=Lasiodiplodia theobromae TaxID=45133 RepID=A0A5N5D4R9_9PEZI|nr:hypothetical protein DBV05_g8606 [Lasiodiplodia theobromae]
MPSTGTSADAGSNGVSDASLDVSSKSSSGASSRSASSDAASDAASNASEETPFDEILESCFSFLYGEPSSDTSSTAQSSPSSDTSSTPPSSPSSDTFGAPHDYPSSPSQVSVESSDSSASSTTDVDTAPSRLVYSWWLLGFLSIVAIAAVSLVLAVLASPGSQHASKLRMNARTDAYYMDEIVDKVYGDLSHNAVVMSKTQDKLLLGIKRAYEDSNLLEPTLKNLWPLHIRNGSVYKILIASEDLRSATYKAIGPVRHFEDKIRPALVKGRRAILDSYAHEKKYDESGPEWFEQEAADLNDRESELSPSSRRRPWTGRELASKMHWDSVCHVHDVLRERLWDLTVNSEEVLVRIEHCKELFDEVHLFASADIVYRRTMMFEDAKRAKADKDGWNARWSTRLYRSNKPFLTTIMSWIMDPEPQEYHPPLQDYAVFRETHRHLSQLDNDLQLLLKGLQYTWNNTLSGPEVDDVVSICSSRDDRGVSTSEEWHQARIFLHNVWAQFGRMIDEWRMGEGLYNGTEVLERSRENLEVIKRPVAS